MPNVNSTSVGGTGVVFQNPAQHPNQPSAGQTVVVLTDPSGKIKSVHGQITNTTVVHDNPA